jgi:hypothetical protein
MSVGFQRTTQRYIPKDIIIRRVLSWMIVFIDTLYIQLGTTGNYRAIADLHTLQFNVTHALGFSVFTSRILATDLSRSHCHFNSLALPNSFLAIILQFLIQFNSIPLL